MEFTVACKMAFDYFRKEYEDDGLHLIEDVGDRWVFSGGNKEHTVFYGKQSIAIKEDGEKILPFILPDKHNFELLNHSLIFEVPEEFRIK